MDISNPIEVSDCVEFRFNDYRTQGVVDFVSHSNGNTWYYVDWNDGHGSQAWYPCLYNEILLVSKGNKDNSG